MALLWSLVVIDPFIVLTTVCCGIVGMIAMLFDPTGDSSIPIARFWARSILWVARTKVRIEGLENLDPHGQYIFCSNHLSYMDTPVILSNIQRPFRFLAKSELFEIPFMGTHLRQAGHVPVVLDDARAAIKTLSKAADTIRERGISLLIFPEGGRSENGELQPFKDGAAYLGIKSEVALVPVALVGTREILPMHGKTFRSGTVYLRFGQPIPTKDLKLRDREQVTNTLRERIVEMLEAPVATNR